MTVPLSISANLKSPGTPLRHMWSTCVGAGRANEGLRADWQRHLEQTVKSCGFRYLRFHGLFHDDMFAYREVNGQPVYNWQYIDVLFDGMLAAGIRPFVEIGFCPRDLATETGTMMWWKGHGSPPNDYGKWAAFVAAFVRHCQARYGRAEVRQWYFEVWNEPNLHPFFTGTRSQYFELYRVTAEAVKGADPALRVGGPATSNFVFDARFDGEKEDPKLGARALEQDPDVQAWRPVWVAEFLRWCAERKVPVDFVSSHPYPTDFALDGHGVCRGIARKREATVEDLRTLRAIVRDSAYPDAEIHCTEWSSSPSSRDHTHDFPQAATYVVMTNLEARATVDSLSYWVFTDVFEEEGAGDTLWHGGFGMMNFQGLAKPVWHAYRFLNLLGTVTLAQGEGYIVTRDEQGRAAALLYHYPAEHAGTVPITKSAEAAHATLGIGTTRVARLSLAGLRPGASFAVETVDAVSGWSRGAWESMGCPPDPTREQLAYLDRSSQPVVQFLTADDRGVLAAEFTLNPWAVMMLREIG